MVDLRTADISIVGILFELNEAYDGVGCTRKELVAEVYKRMIGFCFVQLL